MQKSPLPLWIPAVAAGCLLLVGAAVWGTELPLGIPGEWTWLRRPLAPDFFLGLLPLGLSAGFLFAVVWGGSQRLPVASRWEVAGWLMGLFIAGFSWLWMLQECAPIEARLNKTVWVLYYPGPSGYFTEARYHVTDTQKFLATYEARMSKGDVLHIGTHPPGLIVGYRLLMWGCDGSWLRSILEWSQPESVREALGIVEETSRRSSMPLSPSDRSVLWLAAMIMQCGAAATIFPLYALLRRTSSRTASWLAVSFWPLVPAVAMFLPKSDAFFPLVGTTFLYLWLEGWPRRSLVLCFLAGLVLWIGLFMSLALLPIAFLAGLLTLWEGWFCRPEHRVAQPVRKLATGVLEAIAGMGLPTLCLWLLTGMNLLNVWAWNYHNHAGFYSKFSRTYWMWLLVNPVELFVAAGPPLCLLALCSMRLAANDWRSKAAGTVWLPLVAWACLWLSGKNSGEAARLWILLMPWLVWMAAYTFNTAMTVSTEQKNATGAPPCWPLMWWLQATAGIILLARITGFSIGG